MDTESVSQKPAKTLRRILEERLLTKTQADLAKELGVTQQWVHQHVKRNGPKSVQPRKFPKLAKGLGMTVPEIAAICRRRITK